MVLRHGGRDGLAGEQGILDHEALHDSTDHSLAVADRNHLDDVVGSHEDDEVAVDTDGAEVEDSLVVVPDNRSDRTEDSLCRSLPFFVCQEEIYYDNDGEGYDCDPFVDSHHQASVSDLEIALESDGGDGHRPHRRRRRPLNLGLGPADHHRLHLFCMKTWLRRILFCCAVSKVDAYESKQYSCVATACGQEIDDVIYVMGNRVLALLSPFDLLNLSD